MLSGSVECSVRALVLAPVGRDARLAVNLLQEVGVVGDICKDVADLAMEMHKGAALAIVAEEALRGTDVRPLTHFMQNQAAWSDFPVILLTHRGGVPGRDPELMRIAEVLGNVNFLERPFHMATLASMVRAAGRNRHRQYEARARMAEIVEREQQLSELTRTLEQRVEQATARLRAEVAAREKTQSQLLQSQKMESVGQLTGGIAHDFNNLLMAIMGSLEILRKRMPDDAAVRRLIDGAMQGATRGASLTQRMLAFARQQELRTSSADMGELILGMQELLHRSIGPRIALRIAVAEQLPPAEVDAHQVELAVLNLVINARDAMPEGGSIDIRVDVEEVPSPNPMQLKRGPYLRVQIIDSGVGMDGETLRKSIEPFFSTKAAGKGTGLGLSMTHGLAMQLGGALSLESELGKGTTATLWLPVAQHPARPEVSAVKTPSAASGIRAKILIVDDDPLVANSTVDMLLDLGHSVTEAHSGERAVTLLESDQPLDLLLTDQAMPGMTGMELAEIARRKRPGLPILLVTGYADLPACELAKLPRLAKPYQQAELQAAIEALLYRPAGAPQPPDSVNAPA